MRSLGGFIASICSFFNIFEISKESIEHTRVRQYIPWPSEKINIYSPLASIAVYIYLFSFAQPVQFTWDIFLFVLGVSSILLVVLKPPSKVIFPKQISMPVALLLLAMLVSTIMSTDIIRSFSLSAPFLPAILILLLIAGYFNDTRNIRALYLVFSLIVIGLSFLLLMTAYTHNLTGPFEWILQVNSTILLVKNDVVFFSIVAPFALALIFLSYRKSIKIIGISSIVLTIFVIGVYQSRVAMLTLLISSACFFSLTRPKVGLFLVPLASTAIALIDWFMGFPLVHRFIEHWDGSGRIPLWLCAWDMFLDSPLVGQGPHTFVDFYQFHIENIHLPSWIFVDTRIIPWPHNLYLEILSEQGVLGLMALFFMLVSAIRANLKLRKAASDEIRILSYACFAGLVGFSFAAVTELTFLRQWVVVTMFIFLGVTTVLINDQERKEKKDDDLGMTAVVMNVTKKRKEKKDDVKET